MLIAPEADFIDYGRKILLSKNCDETAVLAALQLANQKWGAVWVNGTEEYKRMCVSVAVKHRREDGTFPETALVEANGGMCQKAARQLEEIYERLKVEANERIRRAPDAHNANAEANDPHGAYWIHYRDIAARQTGDRDYSRIDGMIGIRMRVTGYSPGQIYEAIETNAPAMRRETMSASEYAAKYRGRDWSRFAKETTEKFVFGSRGINQYSQAESFRAYYTQLEGRNFTKQNRAERNMGR
jgi:hypothetical protein